MKISIGADSAGYVLKAPIIAYLKEKGIEVTDLGINYDGEGNITDQRLRDYPTVAEEVCRPVAAGDYDFGIILCGTGIGISMAANKIAGIRAAKCNTYYDAKYARLHNDANVLALGGRVIAPEMALELVAVFISTEFEGGRHARRVEMINSLDKR